MWIRDAAFTAYAFMRIGLTEEATRFMEWIEARCERMVSATNWQRDGQLTRTGRRLGRWLAHFV